MPTPASAPHPPDDEPPALGLLVRILSDRFAAREDRHSGSVVVVLGAGASLESGLRTWDNGRLRRALIEAMAGAFGSRETFVSEAIQQLVPYLPLAKSAAQDLEVLVDHARTDHLCGVADSLHLGRQALLEFLRSEYEPASAGEQPQLAYELIAHLIKHRFVDHVISLNFDEVLDAALNDELGRDGYQRVLPGSSPNPSRSSLPHLFKLHGTISDEDSLRFRVGTTGALPQRMIERVGDVVFGSGARRRSVWIVSLGYSWADRDMRAWLARHYDSIAGVICVNLKADTARHLRSELAATLEQPGGSPAPRVHAVPTGSIVGPGEKPATIDEVLWAVWRETKNTARAPNRVPSAARHLLISHFFPSRNPGLRRWPAVYRVHDARSRFEAEVYLTTGKTDGLVILSSLARDTRVIRHWTAPPPGRRYSLECLSFLKRSAFSDITEVYFFRGTGAEYAGYFGNAGTRLSLSGRRIPRLETATIDVPSIRDGKLVRTREPYLEFLRYYLQKVFDGVSVEVDPGLDDRTRLLFCRPEPLHTFKALTDRTNHIVRRRWTTLLAIAESGKWFLDHAGILRRAARHPVLLIEASPYALSDWESCPPVNLPGEGVLTIGVPWWLHNRHLTLAIGPGGKLQEGIYFRRRERTPRISPAALSEPRDLQELLKIFLSYTARYFEEYSTWRDHDSNPVYDERAWDFYSALRRLPLEDLLPDGHGWHTRLEHAWNRYEGQRSSG